MRRILVTLVLVATMLPFGTGTASAASVTIAAAGDISRPSLGGPPQQTADLVTSLGTTAVFALGDTQYPHGSLSDFQDFYNASWGAFKNKTYPIPATTSTRRREPPDTSSISAPGPPSRSLRPVTTASTWGTGTSPS